MDFEPVQTPNMLSRNAACCIMHMPVELPAEIRQVCISGDDIPAVLADLLPGPLPRRWGRMDGLSRLALAGVGMLLREAGIVLDGLTSGLVTGTACGCVDTDLSYFRTVLQGQPSPLLFSYTLPNIAPSEAAAYFGLQGPVYAVLDAEAPYEAALSEASRLLDFFSWIDLMIFGTLDACPGADPVVKLNLICREAVRDADRLEGGSLGP